MKSYTKKKCNFTPERSQLSSVYRDTDRGRKQNLANALERERAPTLRALEEALKRRAKAIVSEHKSDDSSEPQVKEPGEKNAPGRMFPRAFGVRFDMPLGSRLQTVVSLLGAGQNLLKNYHIIIRQEEGL